MRQIVKDPAKIAIVGYWGVRRLLTGGIDNIRIEVYASKPVGVTLEITATGTIRQIGLALSGS
jgi:hypothetical protein